MDNLGDVKKYILSLKNDHNVSISIKAEYGDSISADKLREFISPICFSLGIDGASSEEKPIDADTIDQALANIHSHFKEEISSENLCEYLKCSRSHISHSFKNTTGMSIRQYIVVLRLNHAKNLLENSDASMAEVATASGFSSSDYFSNVFKSNIIFLQARLKLK